MKSDPPIIKDTHPSPDHCVIWLHGLGADANDFVPVLPHLGLSPDLAIRFIFPNAPIRPITINGGMSMRGWYDISELSLDKREDELGVKESVEHIASLIAEQQSLGIPASKVIVAGFSQGGAISLYFAVSQAIEIAGYIALSSYLPLAHTIADDHAAPHPNTPIFLGHGDQDPVVAYELGLKTLNKLETIGFSPSWNHYPIPHSVSQDELTDIGSFINTTFS